MVLIYDITTDTERPAEQRDIDELQRAVDAYQAYRRAIKQLDKLMTNVGLGHMSQKDFRNVTDRLFKEADSAQENH